MTVADRTPSEIGALRAAASIGCNFDGVNCIAWKGDPAVMICVEPMMTVSFQFVGPLPGVEISRKVIRAPVIGPVARMTIALHLGLTPTEADAAELTAAAAERDLLAYVNAIADKMGEMAGAPLGRIEEGAWSCPPSDPRWIDGQRAAEPWRPARKETRRG